MSGVIETVHEPGFDFAAGLLHGQVCSHLSRSIVERKLAQHQPGTTAGWVIHGEPIPCPDRPGWFHYLVSC